MRIRAPLAPEDGPACTTSEQDFVPGQTLSHKEKGLRTPSRPVIVLNRLERENQIAANYTSPFP